MVGRSLPLSSRAADRRPGCTSVLIGGTKRRALEVALGVVFILAAIEKAMIPLPTAMALQALAASLSDDELAIHTASRGVIALCAIELAIGTFLFTGLAIRQGRHTDGMRHDRRLSQVCSGAGGEVNGVPWAIAFCIPAP